MRWTVCFIAAIAFMAAAVIIAAAVKAGKYKRGRIFTPFNILFIGVFVSTLTLLFPIYYGMLSDTTGRLLKTVAFSMHHTIQAFTMDADRSVITDGVTCASEKLASAYSALLSVAFIIAPFMTFGFLVSIVKNFVANFSYLLSYFKTAYIFSELNERSVTFGENIRRVHRRAVIIYTDVSSDDDDKKTELVERAREIKAICFKKNINTANFMRHCARSPIYFFAINDDENKAAQQALRLAEKYNDRDNARLYVFSTTIVGELLFSNIGKGKLKIRRVNEIESVTNRLLYENGHEIFESAKPIDDNEKKISAVVVGMGAHGTQMLRSLAWYCQMDGYSVEIDAFDKDEDAQEKFCVLAPELMSPKYNGVVVGDEARYTIRIHSGFDVTTRKFADEIAKLTDATYVFVSLGADDLNIKTAAYLRMLFERMKIKPVIKAVVNSTDEKNALEGLKNFSNQPYDIGFIGDINSTYCEDVIINSELESIALSRHLKWGEEDSFWRYEYNYDSSVASAIHLRAKVECGIAGASKTEDELTDEERLIIEKLEHRRWNAYMRSQGYVFSGSTEKSSRNDLGKMHHDLVDYSELTQEEKRKDSRAGTQ